MAQTKYLPNGTIKADIVLRLVAFSSSTIVRLYLGRSFEPQILIVASLTIFL